MIDRPWLGSYPQGVPADIDASRYTSLGGGAGRCSARSCGGAGRTAAPTAGPRGAGVGGAACCTCCRTAASWG
ncbi:MAG TPA: hypothetical protein VLL30_17645, partial [Reyranella sp.]|nr:hypothetical protein [Reyranella sp.]